jgi:hypothetical protein
VVVIWCFGVVSLSGVWTPEVWTSLQISTHHECCFAALLKPSTAQVGIYILHSRLYTTFASLLGS